MPWVWTIWSAFSIIIKPADWFIDSKEVESNCQGRDYKLSDRRRRRLPSSSPNEQFNGGFLKVMADDDEGNPKLFIPL